MNLKSLLGIKNVTPAVPAQVTISSYAGATGRGHGTPAPAVESETPTFTVEERPKPDAWTHVPPDFIRAVCSRVKRSDLVTSQEESMLAGLQRDYEKAEAFFRAVCQEDPYRLWKSQQDKIHELVLKDKTHELPADAWSLEEFKCDQEQRKKVHRSHLNDIHAKLMPIAQAVAGRISKIANGLLDSAINEEKTRAASWNVEYQPSRIVYLLSYVARNPDRLVQTTNCQPKNVGVFAGIKF